MRMSHVFRASEKVCLSFTGGFTEGVTGIFTRQNRGDFLLDTLTHPYIRAAGFWYLQPSPSFPSLLLPFSFLSALRAIFSKYNLRETIALEVS